MKTTMTLGLAILAGLATFVPANAQRIYWTVNPSSDYATDGAVWRADLDGSNAEEVVGGLWWPYGLVLDLRADKVYWGNMSHLLHDGALIQRANLDGSEVETLVEDAAYTYAFAIDQCGDALYWTNFHWSYGSRVTRSRLDGDDVTILLESDNPQTPQVEYASFFGLALDVTADLLYWTAFYDTPTPDGIWRANTDGTGTMLAYTDLDSATRIALNQSASDVFYRAGRGDIRRVRLTGTGQIDERIVRCCTYPTWYAANGLALDRAAGKLYWADYNGGGADTAILLANLDGTDIEEVVFWGVYNQDPVDIALDRRGEPGDFTHDGAVDLEDYVAFRRCMAGPSSSYALGCECGDLDGDGCGEYPESRHPYANNYDHEWAYALPGNHSSINVTFDSRTETEPYCDFIYVMDGKSVDIPGSPFTGTELGAQTVNVPGSTTRIHLDTDRSVTGWGFRVTNVVDGGRIAADDGDVDLRDFAGFQNAFGVD